MIEQTLRLDAGIRAWLEREAQLRAAAGARPDAMAARRRQARERSDALASEFSLPPAAETRIREITLRGARGETFARLYRPIGLEGAAPTQLFLHGGGFVEGTARERVNDSVLSHRARDAGMQLISLEYVLAPEHPYPAARDEALDALEQLRDRAAELGIDADRLGIGGNSAGASIAASAALTAARGQHAHRPHHLALEVPAASLTTVGHIDPEEAREFEQLRAHYLPTPDDEAFIADSHELGGMPPTLIMMAEHDPLRAGGELLAARLTAADVRARAHVIPGTVHGSPGVTAASPAAFAWQALVARELRLAYGSTAHAA